MGAGTATLVPPGAATPGAHAPVAPPERQPLRSTSTPPFARLSDGQDDAPAVVADDRTITYADLRDLADRTAQRLGTGRRLVAIEAANTVACLTAYLAALRAGHVVLMAPPCRLDALARAYEADTTVTGDDITQVHEQPGHVLHPDLALLLSTSGSTGSPKLVRLSARNLSANARAIAEALDLRPSDRAITTLSPAYSYGLSVVNSHLAAGGSLVLTQASVTEPRFWQLARREQVTTLAGVPYTFELMDAAGFRGDEVASLRLLTCAGGRLPAASAARHAATGRAHGWTLALMYGQTEATARMAVQPGALTAAHPDCVGRALPGGEFRIDGAGPDGVGSLVYRGPNVMMGYAHTAADLARGAELAELVTGDRARITPEGLLQIVGRSGRFAKVFGLRIDLDDVDRALVAAGFDAGTVSLDGRIGVAAAASGANDGVEATACRVCETVRRCTGLPPAAISVAVVAQLPRTHTGKVDRAAMAQLVSEVEPVSTRAAAPQSAAQRIPPAEDRQASAEDRQVSDRLRSAFTELLGRPTLPSDSFRSLRGDSLSYVAVSVAIERICGGLPPRWHELTITGLAQASVRTGRAAKPPASGQRRRQWLGPRRWRAALRSRQMDTTVLLRALAIVLVVGSHAGAMDLRGGAHVLVALAGFNFARFHLADPDLRRRARRMACSAAEVLVPALLWVALLAAVTTTYTWNIMGTNWLVNPTTDNPDWRYWFVESLLWILPLAALAVRVPAIERMRRRQPFALPAAATVVAWVGYQLLVPDIRPVELFSPPAVLWVFLLGWTVAAARSPRERIAVTALVLLLVPWSFSGPRAVVIPVAVLLVVWADRVRLPVWTTGPVAGVAEASLFVYLTHWLVLELADGAAALLLSLVVGVAVHRAVAHARRRAAGGRIGASEPLRTPRRRRTVGWSVA